ncbi:histidine--tRNA ligase [Candidatus Roizmanbacteria bacterium RIFCSPHIGHO2_02_FULL_40_13b]|uniref:Histidine--tRNA ligase n=1 Tax=Candidatus Roizmanbacteria bacterium RIFCSPHIGHO2_01_FULL_39_24 TaxID=1802032 RepID=A0A1F7GEJ0_9BACT|nr:MAG: histidine--tRNA ligase [Candidatus Roizmanbacteria bacterium RIFCSPHIGHO2_01_FULL_39_24]OGK27724.1 MAG: histidine--tRNA ligase [Candidatus Roizmanbacteria bacterium RIFCSPHIGHO2_02_FULL_40_13b]OGK49488.1 MAG: histidine--tRNA ligase [Candidatus Roizmanbacteria bacterium RIFCSPLOWO2_01_FULL_40_32]OGK56669.1 MAG: histidine--tRNA ligase [Candidatus Roizmanbacteria bacterium RIFCSPLOWO2_02_FULL_39_8]
MSNGMNIQTLKGFRDFLPGQMKLRQSVISVVKNVFESYGFEPLETPALEYSEILTGKYGEEGDKLMYKFEDNGGRSVALRYDQTVPLARVIAQYQNELPMPFKRYQIQPVWRAENTQRGRYREFLQVDGDIVGTDSILADVEIVVIVAKCLEALGFSGIKIRINDRALFSNIPPRAVQLIDKLKKVGEEKVRQSLKDEGFDETILDTLTASKKTRYLKNFFELINVSGLDSDTVIFDPTLARGLDYYTSLIFEVEVEGYNVGSVCGGGRYDKLIGMFSGNDIPAVGFAFGFDRLIEAMEALKISQPKNNNTVLVTIFSEEYKNNSIELAQTLRQNNIACELYLDETAKLDKQLKYADKKGIAYVIIIGPEEKEKNVVKLKNMKTGEQKEVLISVIPDLIGLPAGKAGNLSK